MKTIGSPTGLAEPPVERAAEARAAPRSWVEAEAEAGDPAPGAEIETGPRDGQHGGTDAGLHAELVPPAGLASGHAPRPQIHPLARAGWLLLGFFLLSMGVVGIFLPGWPTTIFVVLCSACFVRSEPRLARWLDRHPVFGRFMAMARHGMPMRAKLISIAVMWLFVGGSATWMLLLRDEPLVIPAVGTIGLGFLGAAAVLRARGTGSSHGRSALASGAA